MDVVGWPSDDQRVIKRSISILCLLVGVAACTGENQARMLASGQSDAEQLVLAAGNVYWLSDGNLRRVSAKGGPVDTVQTGVSAIASDGEKVFVASTQISRLVAGAPQPMVVPQGHVFAMALDDTYVYWLERIDDTYNFGLDLARAPRAGGAPQVLYSRGYQCCVLTNPAPGTLTVGKDHVYFVVPTFVDGVYEGDDVHRLDKASLQDEVLDGGFYITSLAVDERYLYRPTSAGGPYLGVVRVSLADKQEEMLVRGDQNDDRPAALVRDGTGLFWTPDVWFLPQADASSSPIRLDSPAQLIGGTDIAVDAERIFVAGEDGKVYALHRP